MRSLTKIIRVDVCSSGTFIAESGEFIKGAQREIPTEEFRYCRDLSVNKPSRRLSEGTGRKQYLNVVFNSIGIYDAISGISFQTVKTLDSTLSAL